MLFHVEIQLMVDNALKIKEKIMKWLRQQEQIEIPHSVKQMRLFTINGIEMHDTDSMDMLHDEDYIYFSFGK